VGARVKELLAEIAGAGRETLPDGFKA
jgi:hypothetical protein